MEAQRKGTIQCHQRLSYFHLFPVLSSLMLLTLPDIKTWLQWPWALHPHWATSRGRKELYLLYVSPFQDPFFAFLFKKTKNPFLKSPHSNRACSSLKFLCPSKSRISKMITWLAWLSWGWSPGIRQWLMKNWTKILTLDKEGGGRSPT